MRAGGKLLTVGSTILSKWSIALSILPDLSMIILTTLNDDYLSKVTLFASFTTRHRSGRSKSSELVSDASTAMTIRVSDTWRCWLFGMPFTFPTATHLIYNSFGLRSFRCSSRLRLFCRSIDSDIGFYSGKIAWSSPEIRQRRKSRSLQFAYLSVCGGKTGLVW